MIPVLAALACLQVADPLEFSRPLVELLKTPWPKNRTVTVVCHGHSVPAGFFKTPVVQTFDAYPHLLHQAIKAKFPNAVVNVIVTAIGGEASESGAARFEKDVMALHPDVVTIDYALNDRRLGLEKARASWVSMISAAQKGGAKVVLLTPSWDLTGNVADANDPLQMHSLQIRALAAEYKTGLADSFGSFLKAKESGVDMTTLNSQSNHPNRAGHELILQGLKPWFGL